MDKKAITIVLIITLMLSLISSYPMAYANNSDKEDDYFYYFIHITDLHLGSKLCDKSKLEVFANDVKKLYSILSIKPLVIINTGDIIDSSGDYSYYQYYKNTLDLTGTGIDRLDTAGNHDFKSTDTYYRQYMGSPYYVWDKYINSTHYVRYIAVGTAVVGKAGGCLDTGKLDWLERVIKEAENDPNCIGIWVFGHHPPGPYTDENVTAGGWDYRATPFNDVGCDPWRFIRIISSYSKVLGYIYGHVHVNWVTFHYGKYWIGTAPLTLRGPWPTGVGSWYTGKGYVYRIITVYNGIVSTTLARPGEYPIGLIVNLEQGAVVSGIVKVVAFAISNNPIDKVELYIDGMKISDFTPVKTNEYGGLYETYFNAEEYSEWQHELQIHIVDKSGKEYWSSKTYIFIHKAGGVYFIHSDAASIDYGIREDYPVVRLYIYSNIHEDFPFATIYVPVDNSGDYVRVKALMETEHIWGREMKLRFALVSWKQEPSLNDKHWNNASGMMKLVAGFSTEQNYGRYPYDFNAWRQKGDLEQWYGEYRYLIPWWPTVGYWGQVTYRQNNFTVELWKENEGYNKAKRFTWRYANTEYDYDDIKYVGVLMRSDTSCYSQVAVAYLEVEDANGLRKYHMVPNILGIPVEAKIVSIDKDILSYKITVKITAEASRLQGYIILQGSDDGISWSTISKIFTQGENTITHVFEKVEPHAYYRVIYKPDYNIKHLYAVAVSSPVSAISATSQPLAKPVTYTITAITTSTMTKEVTITTTITKTETTTTTINTTTTIRQNNWLNTGIIAIFVLITGLILGLLISKKS